MKTAIFGGSFNPIHIGHIALAKNFVRELELDRIILVPANIPPHKSSAQLLSGEDRLEMCRLAAKQIPNCEVSDFELQKKGKSYTIKTLEHFAKMRVGQMYLLMGTDMLLSIESWKDAGRIMSLSVLCAAARNDVDYDRILAHGEYLREYLYADVRICNFPATDISSTEIRNKIKNGEPYEQYLIPDVAEYIKEHGLYLTDRENSDDGEN